MKKTPLTPEEINKASDLFFEAFNIVSARMPEGSTIEDTIKCMEQVNKVASKLRQDKEAKIRDERFGFAPTLTDKDLRPLDTIPSIQMD